MFLPLLIAGLVILDQAIWTYRCQLIVRGRRRLGSLLGVLNAIVYVTAVAQVVTNLDQLANIVGYAAGVGMGTYLGILAEERFGSGFAEVRLIMSGTGHDQLLALRDLGWPATASAADGLSGNASEILVIIDQSNLPDLLRDIEDRAPDAMISIGRLVDARPATLPTGYRQISQGRHRKPAQLQ